MSYQDRIKANKRAQFRERQQYNRIRAQLNEEYQAFRDANPSMTAEQIFAAQRKQYTVADGDTLTTIADTNNTTPDSILADNPDMKQVKTGMVINIPGSEAWRVQNAYKPMGGVGLPSNASFGQTTNNPQGSNPFAGNFAAVAAPTPGSEAWRVQNAYQRPKDTMLPVDRFLYNLGQRFQNWWSGANTGRPSGVGGPMGPGRASQTDPFGGNLADAMYNLPSNTGRPSGIGGPMGPGARRPTQQAQSVQPPTQPGAFQEAINAMVNRTPNTQQPPAPTPAGFTPGYQYFSRTLFHNQLRTKIERAGYVPSEGELNILEKMGFIKKTTNGGGGGGYGGYRGYGRGGGGGGYRGRGGGRGFGQPRRQAFSGGNAFNGLVNWRL